MADEFPCKHRASTNDYRDGWGLIWGEKEKTETLGVDVGHVDGDKSNIRDVSAEEIDKMVNNAKNQCDGCNAGYPIDENGLHRVPYPSGTMVCQKTKYQKGNDKISHKDLFKMLDKAY